MLFRSLRATEAAMLLVDASAGVEVGTEKNWQYMEKIGFPRIIFLNKMNKENVNFDKVVEELQEKFGKKVIPFSIPIGEGPDFKGIVDVIFQHAYTYDKGKATEIELDMNYIKCQCEKDMNNKKTQKDFRG